MNLENAFLGDITADEIRDFLLYKKISSEMNARLTRLMAQDESLTKIEALELLLDYYENQNN